MYPECIQDEISFRMDVPMEGDSVDEETGRHDTMITVPPNKVLQLHGLFIAQYDFPL